MVKVYPAIFHKEDDQYWVEFPDLQGCQSYGETIEETIKNATEALGLYIYAKIEDEKELPIATDIKTIDVSTDGFATLIAADPYKYERRTRAIKKTLTIPEWLNDEATKRNINFSSVLREGLERQLERLEK